MRIRFLLPLLVLLLGTTLHAQLPTPKPTVFLYVEGNPVPLRPVVSQTEVSRGWDIQGINVGRKTIRYFWGKRAKQLCPAQPRLAIYPHTENLNDYALIALDERRDHRRLPRAALTDCSYQRVELPAFRIENLPDMGFAVTPLKPLEPGEYILVNLAQKPHNEQGDFEAYELSVEDERSRRK